MRGNISSKLLVICCALFIVSCKAKKNLVTAPAADKTAASETVSKLNAIKQGQTNFNTFSGKARTKLDINGSSNDVTLNIRIQKGQKIWVSVTAIAGIEVARALITPDSLEVINKLQSLYMRKPFSYIYGYTSSQVDYTSLEALLIGNAIPQLLNQDVKMQADSGRTVLRGNLQELVYKLIVGQDLRVSHTELASQNDGQSLSVDNTIFIQTGNRTLPSQINMLSMVRSKRIQMNLRYIKADFDLPLQYPFNIPSGYAEAN
jgi:hypothetical protein